MTLQDFCLRYRLPPTKTNRLVRDLVQHHALGGADNEGSKPHRGTALPGYMIEGDAFDVTIEEAGLHAR